jgi:hypothetical protein
MTLGGGRKTLEINPYRNCHELYKIGAKLLSIIELIFKQK